MSDKIEKLRLANERDKAKALELARKRQAREQKISQLARTDDTRRKILVGSWALAEAEQSPDFHARMLRALDTVWLSRDDDRRLFGLAPLSEEEKSRRESAYGKAGRDKAKEPTDPADASAAQESGAA